MILTAGFLICKALGAAWSWWWIALTVLVDVNVLEKTDNEKRKK